MAQSFVIPLAGFPLLIPLANFLLPSNPSYLLGIPPLGWCDPVHPGPRLLVNWPPPPHPLHIPSPTQIPIIPGFPRSIVRPAKTTSRSRLHIVQNKFCLFLPRTDVPSFLLNNQLTSLFRNTSAAVTVPHLWKKWKMTLRLGRLSEYILCFWNKMFR